MGYIRKGFDVVSDLLSFLKYQPVCCFHFYLSSLEKIEWWTKLTYTPYITYGNIIFLLNDNYMTVTVPFNDLVLWKGINSSDK